jgi:predicted transposase YbfD/YdcC
LEKLALEGCIVTIDTTGYQHKIADQAVEKKADYLFSLKKNSDLPSAETPYEDAREYLKSSIIGRWKQMAWSNEYLEQLLFQSPASSSE